MESIHIGLSDTQRAEIIHLLGVALSNQHVLYIKLRNFHWNLTGPRFSPLHQLFEEHYTIMADSIDETAERMRMLGGVPAGSMSEFLDATTLKESRGQLIEGQSAIQELVKDRETVIRQTRESIDRIQELGDEGTADLLIAQMRSHEKIAWMLRSFL